MKNSIVNSKLLKKDFKNRKKKLKEYQEEKRVLEVFLFFS